MARCLAISMVVLVMVFLAVGCAGGVVQGTLEGSVTIGAEGQPVANAQVAVAQSQGGTAIRTTVTNTEGRYRITNIDRGTYYVTVTPADEGLEPMTQRVTITGGGPTVLNFVFTPRA